MYMESQPDLWIGKSKMAPVRDYSVQSLNVSTRKLLGNRLDTDSITFAKGCGMQQDWQGLAELMGFDYGDIQHIQAKENKTYQLLEIWSQKSNTTVGHLIDFLEQLERFDILEDDIFQKRILMDVDKYEKKRRDEQRQYQVVQQPVQVPIVDSQGTHQALIDSKCTPDNSAMYDEYKNITIGEISTGKPEYFDAFVCYTNSDLPFVKQMINMLEGIHAMRLCIPDRDITPGCAEHTIMTHLISQRCNKMVIIVSMEYLRSPECDFMTKFGHSLAPGARSKKLIPVLIERSCPIPDILRYITLVDYTKCELVEWFWCRLAKALQESSIAMALLFSPHAVEQANEEAREIASHVTIGNTSANAYPGQRSSGHSTLLLNSGNHGNAGRNNTEPIGGTSYNSRNRSTDGGYRSMRSVTGQYGGYVPIRDDRQRPGVSHLDSGIPNSLASSRSSLNSIEDESSPSAKSKKKKVPTATLR